MSPLHWRQAHTLALNLEEEAIMSSWIWIMRTGITIIAIVASFATSVLAEERMLMQNVPVPQRSEEEKKIVERIKTCTVPGAGVGIWGGGDISSNWSFGTTATARLFQYNF